MILAHSHPHVITILIMIAFVVSGQASVGEATNRSMLLISFVRGLGLLLILLPVSLDSSPETRRSLGWVKPKLSDLPQLLLLVVATLLLASLFPLPNSNTILDLDNLADATLLILCLTLASIIEEIFFRSWMLSTLETSGVSRVLAVAISVIAFALIHLRQGMHAAVVSALVGLVYALFFLHRRNLFVLIGAHAIFNIFVLLYHQVIS